MKKFALVLTLSLVMCSPAFATPDPTGRIDAGVGVAALFSTDGGTNDAVFIPGAVNYGLNPNWALGVSSGWADIEIQGDNGIGSTVDAGSETVIPLFFDILYRFPSNDSSLAPYLDLGLGAMLVDHGGNRDLSVNNLTVHDNDGFAVKLAGGIDWFVTENWGYNLELGYILTDASADLTSTATGDTVDTVDLDIWYVGAGVKYRFD